MVFIFKFIISSNLNVSLWFWFGLWILLKLAIDFAIFSTFGIIYHSENRVKVCYGALIQYFVIFGCFLSDAFWLGLPVIYFISISIASFLEIYQLTGIYRKEYLIYPFLKQSFFVAFSWLFKSSFRVIYHYFALLATGHLFMKAKFKFWMKLKFSFRNKYGHFWNGHFYHRIFIECCSLKIAFNVVDFQIFQTKSILYIW